MPSSSTSALRERYGLGRPVDFRKALPLAAAALLLVLLLFAAAALAAAGKLLPGTDRWAFFAYVGLMLALAAALAFVPRLAWVLLAIAAMEIGLSVITTALGLAGIGRTLLPVNEARVEQQFVYHPLLQVVPRPGFEVTRDARTVRHDRFGLRETASVPGAGPSAARVAVVGGSTTYSASLSQGTTWPDRLQERLGAGYRVLNFGVPGYSTAEHVIQTAFYLGVTGSPPRCAIYYVGWNDIRNAHLPQLDPGYADFHMRSQVGNLAARREFRAVRASPLATIVFRQAQRFTDSLPLPPDYRGLGTVAGTDPRLEAIYRHNLASIAALNRAQGVRTAFVAQVLNRAKLTGDRSYGWLPRVRDRDVWPLQARFNDILREEGSRLQVAVVLPDVDAFEDADFVDNGHFSVRGAEKFARQIAPGVAAVCGRSDPA